MDINQKTQHINTFEGGMNTDTSEYMLPNNQYRYAFNLRYIADINGTQGELRPIEMPKDVGQLGRTDPVEGAVCTILAATTIRNTTVVLLSQYYAKNEKDIFGTGADMKAGKSYFYIVRLIFENGKYKEPFLVLGPCADYMPDSKLSLETRYEDESLQKLYIADGKNPIMSINVMKYNGTDISSLYTVPSITFQKLKFDTFIPGSLQAASVQYSYQLYKKYGRESLISPPTKKLDIVNVHTVNRYLNPNTQSSDTGEQYEGVAERKVTNCGVQLSVDIENAGYFDSIKVYRISQFTNSETPIVELIVDTKLASNKFVIKDNGLKALEKLDLGLYNSISGVHIVPQVIKQKNNILFAGNLKEKQFSNEEFENFDARAFSFNEEGVGRVFNQAGDKRPYTAVNFPADVADMPYEYCISKTSDVNQVYKLHTDDIKDWTYDINSGEYDRFTIPQGGVRNWKFYGGSGKNISWKFVVTPLVGDASQSTLDQEFKYYGVEHNTCYYGRPEQRARKLKAYYITSEGEYIPTGGAGSSETIFPSDWSVSNNMTNVMDYSSPRIAMSFKSLRRDELYRYGIVLYDKFGNRSSVRWIADIRVPNMYIPGFQTFDCKSLLPKAEGEYINTIQYDGESFDELTVNTLGIEFTIHNLPKDCVSYEIVRADRTINDIATLSQGVVSRPMQPVFHRYDSRTHEFASMLMPTGLLTTARVWHGDKYHAHITTNNGQNFDTAEASNYRNGTVFQFISPEMTYHKESTFETLKQFKLDVNPQMYVFGSTGFRNYKQTFDYSGNLLQDDPRTGFYAINPAVSNCNLYLQQSRIGMFDTSQNKESQDYSVHVLDQPVNDRHSISLTSFAYFRIFHAIRADHSWNGSGYHPSCLAPTYNSVAEEVIKAQNETVYNNANTFVDAVNRSYSYIKLYNKTSRVFLRGHHSNQFDQDSFYEAGFHGYPAVYAHAYDKCTVEEIKNSVDFGWNDMVDSNEKAKYSTKYQNIGNYNYCNWVAGARFNGGIDSMTKEGDYDVSKFESETNLFGPAGPCLLFSVKNDWTVNSLNLLVNIGKRQSHLFSDTIGTDRYDIPQIKDVPGSLDEPYNLVLKSTNRRMLIEGKDYLKVERLFSRPFSYKEVVVQADKEYNFFILYCALIPESISGTYLTNMRKQTTPYGGYSWDAIQNTKYYSTGDSFVVTRDSNGQITNNKNIVFSGDCYIVPFEYTSLYKFWTPRRVAMTTNITYCIPVETNINIMREYGTTLSKDFDKYEKFRITNIQQQAANVNNKFQQSTPQYLYNSAYSSPNRVSLHLSINDIAKDAALTNLDTRIRYSEQKTNKESSDSWLKFKPANYIDVDGQYGELTHLTTFDDNLIYFQMNAVGRLAVNDRVALQDTNNMQIALGSGGVLERYDYITEHNGMMRRQFCSCSTDKGLYWYDIYRNEILRFAMNGGVSCISKEKNIQSFINNGWRENRATPEEFDFAPNQASVEYDKRYDEVLFTFDLPGLPQGTLAFNEQTQRFTSLYEHLPTGWFAFNENKYITERNKISKYHGDKPAQFIVLSYILNPNPLLTKVFDTQEIVTRPSSLVGNEVTVKYRTKLGTAEQLNPKMSQREGNIQLAIPRMDKKSVGARLRGKTAFCDLRVIGDNTKDISLGSIITKYRISWS